MTSERDAINALLGNGISTGLGAEELDARLQRDKPHRNGAYQANSDIAPDFSRNALGKIRANLCNVLLALSLPEYCGVQLAKDNFRDEIMKAERGSAAWEPFNDEDYTVLRKRIEDKKNGFMPVGLDMVRDCVRVIAKDNAFDSALKGLDDLLWDGKPRIERSLIACFGADDTRYIRSVALYLWTALAGRTLVPGIKADMTPVAVGPQGSMKSSTIAAIAPSADRFAELDMGEGNDDLARRMRGKSIIELAELQGLRGRPLEHIKAFIVRRRDEWIPKYREMPDKYDRRCIFFGSTNESEFLSDETGNRRWLPFNCGTCDPSAMARDREQMWAEGAVLFRKSGILWQEAEQLARPEHDRFIVSDLWDQRIESWLLLSGPDNGEPFTATDVLESCIGLEIKAAKNVDRIRIGKILSRLGYRIADKPERVNGKLGRYWRRKP